MDWGGSEKDRGRSLAGICVCGMKVEFLLTTSFLQCEYRVDIGLKSFPSRHKQLK